MKIRCLKLLAFLLLSQFLSACSNISYIYQGTSGHLTLMSKRVPIYQVLQDETLSKERRKQLTEVENIRQFAYERLKLPKNGSYSSFIELGKRKAITWNIIATEKYSIDPIQTCFPIAGCVSYLLYFDKKRAELEADKHQKLGRDVHIIASPAYSTGGLYDDPVVSTMFNGSINWTAETIFHELAHQRLLRKNDSAFNEAFASAVGEEGTRLWLKKNQPKSLTNYNEHIKKRWQFFNVLLQTSEELRSFYKIKQSEEMQATGKKRIFNQLKKRYADLKKTWGGDKRFDRWFTQHPLNNAKLAGISLYFKLVPKFSKRLKGFDYDFEKFYNYYETHSDLIKKGKK